MGEGRDRGHFSLIGLSGKVGAGVVHFSLIGLWGKVGAGVISASLVCGGR